MIDKIEGIKLLKQAAEHIGNCDYTRCGDCLYFSLCNDTIESALKLTVFIGKKEKTWIKLP